MGFCLTAPSLRRPYLILLVIHSTLLLLGCRGAIATRFGPTPVKTLSYDQNSAACCLRNCPGVEGYTFQPGLLPNEGFIKLPKDSSNSDSTIAFTRPDTAGATCGKEKPAPTTTADSNVTSIVALAAACNARRLCVAFTTSGNLYAARVEAKTWARIPECFAPTCTSSGAFCKGTYVMAAGGAVGRGGVSTVSSEGYAGTFQQQQQQQLTTKDVEIVYTYESCHCRTDSATGEEKAVCHAAVKSQIASLLSRHYGTRANTPKLIWPLAKKSIGCGALC
jgi:hypothetical protein